MGSHTPASEDLCPFQEGGGCIMAYVMAEGSPHITMECVTHSYVALLLLLVSVCCDTTQAKAYSR